MRRFRLSLVCLLCCLLPVQGMALARAQTPCPAEQPGVVVALAAVADARCCNDPETLAETGKLCKIGVDGPTPSPLLPAAMATALAPRLATAFALPAPLAIHARPATIWRPPATLIC